MTREEAKEFIAQSVKSDIDMALVADAIKVLEQQTCEDCISREAVLENIKGLKKSPWFNDDIPGVRIVRKEAVEIIEDLCIKNLPSVNHAEKQELCEDAVSREAVLDIFADNADAIRPYSKTWEEVKALPSVNPQPKTGHCKDCKYFEYDSVVKVNRIPLVTVTISEPNNGITVFGVISCSSNFIPLSIRLW